MRTVLRKSAVGAFAASMFLAAGCGVNTKFVYRPDPPIQGTPKLPVKVAVLPFADGTENFTQRGSVLDPDHLTFNLAKTGIWGTIDAITPELWAKSFAEDLEASGVFQAVRFVYSPAEVADEDLLVDGTVVKADQAGSILMPSRFALVLRARRKADDAVVWEKGVEIVHTPPKGFYDGCGLGVQCMADRFHVKFNGIMKAMFAEARSDLVRTVAAGNGATEPAGGSAAEGTGAVPASRPSLQKRFIGVGMEIGVVNDTVTVARTLEGAPAQRAGILPGDEIIAVDGRPTAGMSVADVASKVRGDEGTPVTMTVRRAGWATPKDFTILREPIGTEAPSTASPSVDETIERILKEK